MKFGKTMWMSASLLALSSQAAMATAQDMSSWQARTVDQVLAELEVDENQQVTYLVKEGDTLSVIAEAMQIELHYLANINGIDNVDLILPGTKLVAQFNQDQQATNLTVNTPQGQSYQIDLPVNLTSGVATEEVSADVVTEEISTPVAEEVAVEEIPAETTTLIGGGEQTESLIQAESVEANSENETYSPAMVEEWVEESPATEEATVSESEPVLLEENPDALISTPVGQADSETVDSSLTDNTATDSSALDNEIPVETEPVEEISAPVETPVEETTTVEVSEQVPVEEIPESVQEDIEAEEEIPAEDIVVEDPEEVEEIVDQPDSPDFDPMANPENAGLQANVAAYKEEVANKFGITSFSLYRPGDDGDHGAGKAVDFMVPVGSQLGDDVANYSIANMAEKGISYVIWEQQIYGDWNNSWSQMEDRGGITANHYDHVHVSFN